MCVCVCVQDGYRPVDIAAYQNHCAAAKFLASVVRLDEAGFAKALGLAKSVACKVRVNVRVNACACVLWVRACVCFDSGMGRVCAFACAGRTVSPLAGVRMGASACAPRAWWRRLVPTS